jgi:rare lipoprotein A
MLTLTGLALCACASPGASGGPYRAANLRPYEIGGRIYTPQVVSRYNADGVASWYDYPVRTHRTATGEWFDPRQLTGAHRTLPLPCEVEVTNLENGRKIRVRINDRGPFNEGRLIDLSRAAADQLGFTRQGTTRVRVRLLGPAPLAGSDQIELARIGPDGGSEAEAAQLY